jgi:NurA-like 5'-3' nuclease
LSYKETERWVEDKLNGLRFLVDTTRGLCTMALGEDAVGSDVKEIDNDCTFEVSHSTDDLIIEVEEPTVVLASQDKFLRLATHERKYYKGKYESMLRELKFARALVVVFDETKCDECALHMSNITTLQTKYATLLDECNELQSRSSLLGACQTCSSF